MTLSLRKSLVAAIVLVGLFLTGLPAFSPADASTGGVDLDAERGRGEKLVETLRLQDALGPLAPVALSPFFALTCLSGASLLSGSGLLPDALANNSLLGSGSFLNNGFVFTGLLALTLLTSIPKLTKVTKPLGQAIDQIEAHAGIISVVAVQLLSQIRLGAAEPEPVAMVVQAGVFTFSYSVLLAVFSAINIFVVNTVKFFFEVLVFLSPFPTVDAIFEAMNKAVVAFLVSLYVLSPWLATVVNLLLFAACLLIFAWIHRRVVYMRSVIGDPLLGWLAERLFRRKPVTPVSTILHPRLALALPERDLVLKAFAGRGLAGVSRKTRGYLIRSKGRLYFAKARLARAPILVPLVAESRRVRVATGILSNAVVVEDAGGETIAKIVFTRRYNPILAEIGRLVGAEAVPEAGTRPGPTGVFADGRSLGAAVKGGDAGSVRAELA